MNDMTKLILTFVAGVIVGVLAATSTLFRGEPEPTPTQAVTSVPARDAGAGTEQETGESSKPVSRAEQPAPEPQSPAPQVEEPRAGETSDLAEAEPVQASEAEPDTAVEDGLAALASAGPEPESTVFCMQKENSGECQCYDVQTMAAADVSPAECRERLEEE